MSLVLTWRRNNSSSPYGHRSELMSGDFKIGRCSTCLFPLYCAYSYVRNRMLDGDFETVEEAEAVLYADSLIWADELQYVEDEATP